MGSIEAERGAHGILIRSLEIVYDCEQKGRGAGVQVRFLFMFGVWCGSC
jgi:hypothetical protein